MTYGLFTSAPELAQRLRDAEAAHGQYEKTLGKRDENWADWYAQYILNPEDAGNKYFKEKGERV